MSHRSLKTSLAILTLLFPMSSALATGVFPDVGDNHPFKGEIEALFRQGVVKGNPSGTFNPDDSVTRAAFLKMLYTATKRQPKAIYKGCFKDVESGSWYELIVCDAASKENGFVSGYGNGTFGPANPVTRTEALKMTFNLFGIPAPDVSSADQDIIKFADISVSAWYTRFISAAYKNGILPIYGFGGSRFYPDREMTRAESAGFVFNAERVIEQKSPSTSSSSSVASSESMTEEVVIKQVQFPFNDTGMFSSNKPIAYEFTLSSPKTIVSVSTSTVGKLPIPITCRLYLLTDDGFSDEYYLGLQDDTSCRILSAVRPGKYQLQVQSTANTPYTVDAKSASTDGNDGFIDAHAVALGSSESADLGIGDLYDWYTFTVPGERKGTFFVSSPERLSCIIYTPSTVDQFGFAGPECGVEYNFASGTYTVGVGRKATSNFSKAIEYSVHWR